MLKVLNSIISDEANRDVILEEQVICMELMGSSESKTWRKRHNFMDRVRKSIGFDPLFKAEVVLNSAEEQTELGIMSVEDPAFYPRLYNLTKTLESTGLDVQVRKVLGGVWEWQENYNPQNYTFDDYPTAPAKEQFSRQQPMGRQSVFHLEMEDDSNVARSDVEGALYFALAENTIPVYKLESITEVGDGFVVAALSSEGSIIVVFDGKSHVNVNIFSHDEWEERPDKIMGAFSLQLPFNMIQRDEQPRGTERVINFMSDIHPTEDDNAPADTEDEAPAEIARKLGTSGDINDELYQCPSTEMKTAENDIAGYYNYYDKDNERHLKNSVEDNEYYTVGFRDVKFGGRVQTYTQQKKKATKYKAKAYGDNLLSGDLIYEGACGEGFNLLLTIEILKEQRGIENLTAFGSDYLAASAEVASKLFSTQANAQDWIRTGQFCQGDSTQLDFVPSDTFDLAFTYVDPLIDPLRRHDNNVPFANRMEMSKELCDSDDEADHDVLDKEQEAQEDWHASWVEELIRIVKPGKVIIIEDVDSHICDDTSDWGGVPIEWWEDAVSKYNWDVVPDSIEIVEGTWYHNRYNVLMRKNSPLPPKMEPKTLEIRNPPKKCPNRHWNERMNVYNAEEFDVSTDVVKEIWKEYETDLRPHLNSGKSTDDFCLVTPYNTDTNTWDNNNGVMRSDIKWFSVRNENTYDKYLGYVDRLGLRELVKDSWVSADEVTVYAMFFIPRSFSREVHYHIDWYAKVHTQVMTFLIPVNDFDIHLKYKDVDGNAQDYEYKFGKAIGFGGGFFHSTGIGQGEEEDVLLCVYLGSDDPDIWELARANIADELEYYMSPINGFTRNEMFPNKSICQ
uniref:Methyltransferase domain-containing protein n=1 Tax=Odontella aurita TaxID=265563 RepID=A0A7S4IDD9_9STRA